jgi:hypothetical protein
MVLLREATAKYAGLGGDLIRIAPARVSGGNQLAEKVLEDAGLLVVGHEPEAQVGELEPGLLNLDDSAPGDSQGRQHGYW